MKEKRSILSRVRIGGIVGAVLAGLAVPILVFVIDPPGLNLQTGVRWIDSMLYSIGGPTAIVILAFIWATGGVVIGSALGFLYGTIVRMNSPSK